MIDAILKAILSEKGRDLNRSLVFVLVLYTAYKVTEVDKSLAAHIAAHRATVATLIR